MHCEERERKDLQRETVRIERKDNSEDREADIDEVPGDLETGHFSFIVNSLIRPFRL